jgi:hypothetical protein
MVRVHLAQAPRLDDPNGLSALALPRRALYHDRRAVACDETAGGRVMTEPAAGQDEAGLLFSLVRQRYGERLTAAELEAVRTGVATIVDAVRALRAVRLDNADGPALPRFPDVPLRS